MCCENLTGNEGRISITHVFVHKADEMQLRHNRNCRSAADLWADVRCTFESMPGPAPHLHSLCATLSFQWGHEGHGVTVSLTLPFHSKVSEPKRT